VPFQPLQPEVPPPPPPEFAVPLVGLNAFDGAMICEEDPSVGLVPPRPPPPNPPEA